jgi:hypothetical protein
MKNLFIFAGIITFVGIALIFSCQKPLKRYVGTVESVSSWNGYAQIKTKGLSGQDTSVTVIARRRERFVIGQVITTWSGGDLIRDDVASTDPQASP